MAEAAVLAGGPPPRVMGGEEAFVGEPLEPIGGEAGERTHEVMLAHQAKLADAPPLPNHLPLPENVRVLPREELPIPLAEKEAPADAEQQAEVKEQPQSKETLPQAAKEKAQVPQKQGAKVAHKAAPQVKGSEREPLPVKTQVPVQAKAKAKESPKAEIKDRQRPEAEVKGKERHKPSEKLTEKPKERAKLETKRESREQHRTESRDSGRHERVDKDRDDEEREHQQQQQQDEQEEEEIEQRAREMAETFEQEAGAPALPPAVMAQVLELEPTSHETVDPTPQMEGVAGGVQGIADSIWAGLQQAGETLVWVAGLPAEASRHFLDLDNKEQDPEIEHTSPNVLVPFKCPDNVKAAINRRFLECNFQVIILHVLKQRVTNIMQGFLKNLQRALFLDRHMKWVKYTQGEIRDTVEKQQTWGQWGMMAGTLVGTLGPSMVINSGFSDAVRKIWQGFPDFSDALVKGDWMKKAQTAGQMIPMAFQTQAQVYQSLGQAQQFGGQARTERAFKRADSAGNQLSEVKQDKIKVADLGKSVLDTVGGLARQIFQW